MLALLRRLQDRSKAVSEVILMTCSEMFGSKETTASSRIEMTTGLKSYEVCIAWMK